MLNKTVKILFLLSLFCLDCGSKKVLFNEKIYTRLPCGLMYRDLKIGRKPGQRGYPLISYSICSKEGIKLHETDYKCLFTGGYETKSGRENSMLLLGMKGMRIGGVRELIISPNLRIGQTWIPFFVDSEENIFVTVELLGKSKIPVFEK